MSVDDIILSILNKIKKSKSAFLKIFYLTLNKHDKNGDMSYTIITKKRLEELLKIEKNNAQIHEIAKEMLVIYRNNETKK